MIPLHSVTDLKTKSATLISSAQQGQAAVILKNNRPVAALIPYHEKLEDILEEIGWLANKELHAEIKKARRNPGRLTSAKDLRKEFGL